MTSVIITETKMLRRGNFVSGYIDSAFRFSSIYWHAALVIIIIIIIIQHQTSRCIRAS